MAKKYNAFLSHNSQDKPVVEQIAQWLEDESNLSVWLDKWNLVPGEPWQEEIEIALDDSQCCVVFLGPNGMGSWQNEEMRLALEKRVFNKTIRVVPVLLPGAKREEKESKLPGFLRRLTWVEFSSDWQEPETLRRLVCGIKGIAPGREAEDLAEDTPSGECPFRGLEVFREQDRRFFFGRDELVQRLMAQLKENRFLAVIGPSGCGKSSAVQAGVIPLLRQDSLAALFTPRERPLEELVFAMWECVPVDHNQKFLQGPGAVFSKRAPGRRRQGIPPVENWIKRLKESGEGLHYIARELLSPLKSKGIKRLILVIDQFEELFTQTGSEEERCLFIAVLLKSVEVKNGPVTVIITMRSDFMGKCAYYRDLNIFITDYLEQVGTMSREELEEAIEKPAQVVGLRFENGLVKRILDDVKGAPAELPLLEHALLELYQYKPRQGSLLTAQAYEAIGRIEGALLKRAESEFKDLDDQQKDILRKMFVLRLIQPGEGTEDTRRRISKKELLILGRNPKEAEYILNRWVSARLLTITHDALRKQDMVDVAHEALIRKWNTITEWMKEDREASRQIGILRQAALEWDKAGKISDYLFQGIRLAQMKGLLDSHEEYLTEIEKEFIRAGVERQEAELKAKEERQQRELQGARELAETRAKAVRRSKVIIGVVLVALAALLYLAYRSNINEKNSRKQLARNYWENARQAREEGKSLLALHLFGEALWVNPDPEFYNTLLLDMNEYWNCHPLSPIFQLKGGINGAMFNYNGTRLLTWGKDNTARLWDTAAGKPIEKEMLHKKKINGAIFNQNGSQVLTWSRDGTARLWNAKSGEPFGLAMRHGGNVFGAVFNCDERLILTWSDDNTARLWDAESCKLIDMEMKHQGEVNGAIFNCDGSQILTWSDDGTARLWDTDKGEICQEMAHKQSVMGAMFNSDCSQILTWSRDGTARLWDTKNGNPISLLMKHGNRGISGATFNRDETIIMTWNRSYRNGSARLWNASTGEPIGDEISHREDFLFVDDLGGARFNRDGSTVLTWGRFDRTARLWDAKSGKPTGLLMKHQRFINGAIFNCDATRILTWGEDGTARLWDAKNGKPVGMVMRHQNKIKGAVFNWDGKQIFTWSSVGNARLWYAETGQHIIAELKHQGSVDGAIFNGNEKQILTWGEDGTARLWDATKGKPIGFEMKHQGIMGAAFNRYETNILSWCGKTIHIWGKSTRKHKCLKIEYGDYHYYISGPILNHGGTRILIGYGILSSDGTVFGDRACLLDTATGKNILDVEPFGFINGAKFNHDDTCILTWIGYSYVRLLDATTLKQIIPEMMHSGVLGATFDRDETRILTWSDNGTIRLWDTATGKQIGLEMRYEGKVNGALFNRDGTRILTWTDDGTVRLWNTTTGKKIGLEIRNEVMVHGALFNQDETSILTWSDDGIIRFWDVVTGKPIGIEMKHKDAVNGAVLNRNETAILTWSKDGSARLWDIGVDWDFPKEHIKLQIMVLTGSEFDAKTMEIKAIESERWRELKERYLKIAAEHYKTCRYRDANVYRKLFLKEKIEVDK